MFRNVSKPILPPSDRGKEILLLLAALLIMAVGGASHSLAAQSVQGQLLDRETRAPVEGALVVLVGTDGSEHDGYLTNASGRFLLRAKGQGTYLVRADRIGFARVSSDHFDLSGGQTHRLVLETGHEAIALEGITVQGNQRCVVRPGEGLQMSRVWEEARKALTVQDWTEREGVYEFELEAYSRDMDPDARWVLEETSSTSTGASRSPIQSLPAEDLMTGGFVRKNEDETLQYYGPDASTLLSDAFLDTHCFELAANSDAPDLVGLAFEPVRVEGLPDIRGTLWLDRESSALQFLEYEYTWAGHPTAQGVARGRVDFEELPNGTWIVRKWWIRMPQLGRDRGRTYQGRLPGLRVVGVRETGGEVLRVTSPEDETDSHTERGPGVDGGLVSGLVWDSTRSAPLEGAEVFLSGTSHAATADAEGRFSMDGVPEGVFTVAFTHSRLDSLRTVAGGVKIQVIPGEVSEALLAVPSMASIIGTVCAGETRGEGTAVVSGLVRDQETGEPIPGATVRISRLVASGADEGREREQAPLEVTTDGNGRFTACNVSAEELLDIQASLGDRETEILQLRLERDTYTVLEMEVPPGFGRTGSPE